LHRAESLPLATAKDVNRKKKKRSAILNVMEKVVTKNNLLGKLRNIFNMDEIDIQANKEFDSVTAEKRSKGVHVLTS
jgi:hypothetical protein